ncbi:MAG: hypothetical protein KBD94_00945 [Pyrinomonadaceae bacterium]|nr:hypothetical protein [Pyrinomonadaceae bacterium]
MPSKYDTNPLDPEFPEKVGATKVLGQANAGTRQFPPPAPTEEQTRRFAVADVPYSPPFDGQNVPAPYQAAMVAPADRKVDKVGLPENVLTAAPYIPWYIGLIAGLLILFLVPKSEAKVRFHAAQGLAAHIGILIVTTILGVIGEVTDLANIGNLIFTLVTSIMLVVFAIKAWQGKPVHIESIEDLTSWLEDKISPRVS